MDKIQSAKEFILKEVPNVKVIYLFGSYATKEQNEKSDLDLAILCEKKIDKEYLWDLSQKLATKLHLEIDLIDLMDSSTIFAFQIISEGKLLYCSDAKFLASFVNNTDWKYLKLNEVRKYIIEDIQKRKEVY